MAITVVGRASAVAGNSSSLTINVPSGTASGHLMIAAIVSYNNSLTITPPSGWTLWTPPGGQANPVSSGALQCFLYYRYAGASEPASYTWNWSGGAFPDGGIVTYAGTVTSGDPIDVSSQNIFTSVSTATFNSITTTQANDYLACFMGSGANSTVSMPGGLATEWQYLYAGGSNFSNSYFDKALQCAGATGNLTASMSGSVTGVAWMFAILAAPATLTISVVGESWAAPGGAATSLTINVPSGTASGQLMIASIVANYPGLTITAPSGWTLWAPSGGQSNPVASTALLANWLYYRYASASEPASYTWSWTGGSPYPVGGIVTYSGAATSGNPIDVSSQNAFTSATTITFNGITTTQNNDMLVCFPGWQSAANFAQPGGFSTEWAEPYNAGQNFGAGHIDEQLGTAGATGNKTATSSAAITGVAWMYAILANSGPPPVTPGAVPVMIIT